MPLKAVSVRRHTPLHTAFQPSKHPLKSLCASAYSNGAVCFVNRREQIEDVAGSRFQDREQSCDFVKQWSQQDNKTDYEEIITWHYVNVMENDLASD